MADAVDKALIIRPDDAQRGDVNTQPVKLVNCVLNNR